MSALFCLFLCFRSYPEKLEVYNPTFYKIRYILEELYVAVIWIISRLIIFIDQLNTGMHMCDVLPCVSSFSVRGEGASNGVLHIKGVDQLFNLTIQKKLKIMKKFNFPTQKKPCKFEVNITRNMCVNRKFPLSNVHLTHKTLHGTQYTHMWSKQVIFALLVRPKTRYLIKKYPKLTQIGSSLFIETYDLLLSLLEIIR